MIITLKFGHFDDDNNKIGPDFFLEFDDFPSVFEIQNTLKNKGFAYMSNVVLLEMKAI